MTVVRELGNLKLNRDSQTVVTVGTFDGIHRGHQEILRRMQTVAADEALQPVLVTFHPHPRVLVTPEDAPLLLTSVEEQERLLPLYFKGTVLVLEFNSALKDLSAGEFVKSILVDRVGVRKLIMGYDHAMGRNRSGTIMELTKLGGKHGFEIDVVGPIMVDNKPISSTRIRKVLAAGQYSQALRLLGHEYPITGIVERGIGLGKKLGYPTANLRYNSRKLLPPEGVYACRVHLAGERRRGMMFIGRNHFNPEPKVTVEAHLFDFAGDIYGQEVTVFPAQFIRQNRKYDSPEKLVAQIGVDKKDVLKIFEKEKENVARQRAQTPGYC